MLRPTAWDLSTSSRPSMLPTSVKYSLGLMRASAPVGQFSSQLYLRDFLPGGLRVARSLQRLHLIATRSSVASTAEGIGSGLILNKSLTFDLNPPLAGASLG